MRANPLAHTRPVGQEERTMAVTLRNLSYLVALADAGHFGRAAERVAISQPALSQQIKELEAELGLQLVERGREIRLTRSGVAVVERARAILGAVRDLEETARRTAGLSGPLRLGLIPTVAPYLLSHLLPLIGGRGLELTVMEAVTERLLAALGDGDVDAAVVALPVSGDFAADPLFEDRFLLASSRDEPPPGALQPEDVAADRLLLLDEGHCLADQALAVCNTRRGRTALGAASLTTLSRLVADGYGITLLPEMAVPVEGRGLILTPFAAPEPSRTIGLVRRLSATTPDWVPELCDVLRHAHRTLTETAADTAP